MQPTTGRRANIFGDIGGESHDIMIERPLQFLATLEAKGRPSFNSGKVAFGYQPLAAKGFADEQFDSQPGLKLVRLAPNLSHLRPRIPCNHDSSLGGDYD